MYISADVLLLLQGAIFKVSWIIQMELRHWIQDKWEAIPYLVPAKIYEKDA